MNFMVKPEQDLWLNTMLLKAFMKNGFALKNGGKSWELTDLQYLSLTDDLAKGFLSFSENPNYRKQFFELEVQMIHQQARDIAEAIGEGDFNLIDIYCGNGLKAVEFIKAFNSQNNASVRIRYCPLNASQYLVDLATSNVKKAGFLNVVDYKPFLSSGDGRAIRPISKNLRTDGFDKNVVIILGGVIACFDINEYLFELSRDLQSNDVLVMGNGIRVGERLVDISKYKNSIFHDWFKHLILGLGFVESDVEFDARFDNSRVEFLYRFKTARTKKAGKRTIEFKPGDELVVAALYKYYAEEFDKFCKMYFANAKIVTDKDNGYALVVCKK